MKYTLLITLFAAIAWSSCSKDKTPQGPSDEDILTRKIEDIIPQQYLDTLKKLGLEVHTGTRPPNVEGSYSIKPQILDTSNIPSDRPGQQFTDGKVTFFEQSNEDFSIKLIGEHFLHDADTSIATAISGSGNDFTVYGKVKSTSGPYSIVVAIVVTATKEGDDLKNYKIGVINVDNSNGGTGIFIKEGEGRVAHDGDFISEKIAGKVSPESILRGANLIQYTED
jgi:hypothetical protein